MRQKKSLRINGLCKVPISKRNILSLFVPTLVLLDKKPVRSKIDAPKKSVFEAKGSPAYGVRDEALDLGVGMTRGGRCQKYAY